MDDDDLGWLSLGGDDPLDLQNLPDVIGSAGTPRELLYSNEAYGPGMTGEQTSRYDTALDLTGSKALANIAGSGNWSDLFKSIGGAGKDFLASKGGIAALMALLSYLDRQKSAPQGGGTTQAYAGPAKPYTPRTEQGKYGPIMRYAADGGLMHAYANGGEAQAYAGGKPLMMEDGGFVFTEEATRELEPRGIAALGGKMITAPGNGTNDKGITGIIGKNGVTPARVSDGESYFPRHAVENQGGPQRMYALMNNLQRSA